MRALLRQEFVNCWVLAKDLEAIAARDGSPDVATLCKLVRDNYDYPVDSVLVSADLRVLGHVNVHGPVATDPARYLAFLRQGLTAAGRTPPAVEPEVPPKAGAAGGTGELVVTPERPSTSLLDVVRCNGFGQTSFAYHPIDATAFADGGVLEIEVRVGRAGIGALFELCAPEELPPDVQTAGRHRAVVPVSTRSVAAGGTDKLVHVFKQGGRFGIAVKPAAGSTEGDSNAFLATVTVRRP